MALSRISPPYRGLRDNHLRGNRCTLESSLPLRVDDIAHRPIGGCEGITKIFAKLWNSNHIASCLVLKTDQENDPNSIHAPCTSPRVLAEGCKFADFVIFLVGKVAEVTRLS